MDAIIVRHDERYLHLLNKIPDITPTYAKASFKTGTNKIAVNTEYYPLGDADTISTKDGYLSFTMTGGNSGDGANITYGYEVHIGDKVYTRTETRSSLNALYGTSKLCQTFKIPVGVTVSFKLTRTGTWTASKISAICTAE